MNGQCTSGGRTSDSRGNGFARRLISWRFVVGCLDEQDPDDRSNLAPTQSAELVSAHQQRGARARTDEARAVAPVRVRVPSALAERHRHVPHDVARRSCVGRRLDHLAFFDCADRRSSHHRRQVEETVSNERPIECVRGYRKPARCRRCKRPIVWVLELVPGGKPTHRPFSPASTPFEKLELANGVRVERYDAVDAFHRCPPKRRPR